MRICLVSEEYPPETAWGGIGTYTWHLGNILAKRGHSIYVISTTMGDTTVRKRINGIFLSRIALPRWPHFSLTEWRGSPLGRVIRSYQVARAASALVKEYELELIEAPDWGCEAFLWSFWKKVPLIIRFHTPLFVTLAANELKETWRERIIEYIEECTAKHATGFSAPGQSIARIVSNNYKIPYESIITIANPLAFGTVQAIDVPNSKVILYVGRLEWRKGIDRLIRIMPSVRHKIPNARLVVVGGDTPTGPGGMSCRAYLSRLAENNGSRSSITFTGHLPHDKLMQHYRVSQMCAFPARYEAFGYTCAEAMAYGRPVIASRVGEMAKMIQEDSCGYLVSPNRNDRLLETIIYLLNEFQVCRQMGHNAWSRIREYASEETVAEQVVKFYESLIRNNDR